MAENGVQTNNVTKATLVDEVLGNREGSTVAIKVSDLLKLMPGEINGPVYETLAELSVDLAHEAGVVGLVWRDGDSENDGLYQKAGDAGEGAWERYGDVTMNAALLSMIADIADQFGDVAGAISKAQEWAEKDEDVEVESGEYSAKHHAKKALKSETAVAQHAADAETARDIAYDATLVGDRVYSSWVDLSAVSFTAGQWAYVDAADTGTHTDPINSTTVPNAGYYKISADGYGSVKAEWIRDYGLPGKVDKTSIVSPAQDIDLRDVISRACQTGYNSLVDGGLKRANLFDKDSDFIIPNALVESNGTATSNTDFYISHPIPVDPLEDYTIKRATFIGFYQADGAFIERQHPNNDTNYTVTSPAGAAWMVPTIPILVETVDDFWVVSGDTAPVGTPSYDDISLTGGPLEDVNEIDARVETVEDALSVYVSQDITTVDGYYIDKNNGDIVEFANFHYALWDYTEGEKLQASALLLGTGIALAVYYDSEGEIISSEYASTTESVTVTDYDLTIPEGTAQIGICGRNSSPLDLKKSEITSPDYNISQWAGKTIDVMGDSNVEFGLWQAEVASRVGCTFINNGVGGSKVSKPDSQAWQVSMCDDARVDALDTSADAWFFGPALTNDWAQNTEIGTIDDTVNTTVYGALKITLQKMIARAPTMKIVCVTPFNTDFDQARNSNWVDGVTNQYGNIADYAQAMRDVAGLYGIPVIDLQKNVGWSHLNSEHFLLVQGTAPSQYRIHLDDAGVVRVADVVEAALNEINP
jgi:hypothetical protein